MINVIIFAVISLVSVIIFFTTKALSPHVIWKILFPIALLIGITLVVIESAEIRASFKIRKWPTAEAKVISSQIAGVRAFHPDIKYQYQVQGVTYVDSTDMNMPEFENKRSRHTTAGKIVGQYSAGTVVTIHYDPENPAISKVSTSASYSAYLILTVGAMLYGTGVFWALNIVARYLRKQSVN